MSAPAFIPIPNDDLININARKEIALMRARQVELRAVHSNSALPAAQRANAFLEGQSLEKKIQEHHITWYDQFHATVAPLKRCPWCRAPPRLPMESDEPSSSKACWKCERE